MAIRLWGRPSSARTQKILLALAEIDLEFELILASATMGAEGHTSKGNTPYGVVDTPEYQRLNPNGTVPTINDDGYVLWESNAILLYLAMKYAPTAFYGDNVELFCSASRWIIWENNELIPPMHNYVLHTIRLSEAERDSAVAEDCRMRLAKAWRIIDDQLSKTEHIAADTWSFGDIPMTIRVHRWSLLDGDWSAFPNIARYYDVVRRRSSFTTIANPNMHLAG
jgi:glutathione S-transferase